jgi:malate synthase
MSIQSEAGRTAAPLDRQDDTIAAPHGDQPVGRKAATQELAIRRKCRRWNKASSHRRGAAGMGGRRRRRKPFPQNHQQKNDRREIDMQKLYRAAAGRPSLQPLPR